MIITNELAQQIVDKIIPLTHQNVNIMNIAGIIIGSGQKDRLNSFHKGSKVVIDTGKMIEIYPENVDRYPGSLPGLNWPIILGEKVVGVVGISGHPDFVRNTAALVKMVTELILERETFMEEFRSQSHFHEQFAISLLSEQVNAIHSSISARADLLKFELDLPRLIAVTNVRPILDSAFNQYGLYDLISSRTRESLLQLMENTDLVTHDDLVAFLEDKLVIFKHFSPNLPIEQITEWGTALINLINTSNPETPLQLGVGSLVKSPLDFRISYKEALFVLDHQKYSNDISSIYDFDILTSYLIQEPQAKKSCKAFKALQEKLSRKFDFKYDMRNTIQSLLDNDLNISATAKALFIHRNTLIFRLEKLSQLTGLCPSHKINHAILCKILCDC